MHKIETIHSLTIRFQLNNEQQVKDLFSKVEADFSKEKLEGEWFNYDENEMNNKYGAPFNYVLDSFGNFIDKDIDCETCLDIAALALEDTFEPADMLLFYQGKLGEENALCYLLHDEHNEVVYLKKDMKNATELVQAIQKEIAFLEFATTVKRDVVRSYEIIRKAYAMLDQEQTTKEVIQELLSEDFYE